MSYNIDDVRIVSISAEMDAKELLRLYEKHEENLPEANVLADHRDRAVAVLMSDVSPKHVKLTSFDWRGDGSGWGFKDILLAEIAPKVVGTVEAILTWEGGDSVTGLRIRDGVVSTSNVRMTLEES